MPRKKPDGQAAKSRKKAIQTSDEEETQEPNTCGDDKSRKKATWRSDEEETQKPNTWGDLQNKQEQMQGSVKDADVYEANPATPSKLKGKAQLEAQPSPNPASPAKSAEKPKISDLKPIASPGAQQRKQTKESTVTVHVAAMTWGAWSMSFRVFSTTQGKEIDAWTGPDTEPDTIAFCLKNYMKVAWAKERRRSQQDQWHFVRLTPDIKCSKEGFAKIQASVQALFNDKRAEWSVKPDAELTNQTQKWIKTSWTNQLTFTLTNSEFSDGDINPWPWDKYMSDRSILRLALACFPGTSYRDLDTAGGFYGEATDEEGNIMTLEKAANPPAPAPEDQGSTKRKQYDD
jgi:hypothetical protein